MGAEFLEEILDGSLSKREVTERFDQLRSEARDEYGHRPYSGSWKEIDTLSFALSSDKRYKTAYDEALLMEKGEAVAVKVRGYRPDTHAVPNNISTAKELWDEREKTVERFVDDVLVGLKTTRSKARKCACGSSIVVSYLQRKHQGATSTLSCPVCARRDFAMTARQSSQKQSLLYRVEEAKVAYENTMEAFREGSTAEVWAIFAWARC